MYLICTKEGCESEDAVRDRKYIPERGLDPMLRRYTCKDCGMESYIVTGRKWLGRSTAEFKQVEMADPIPAPARPKKRPPTKPAPAEAPVPAPEKEPVGAGV